MSSSTSPVMRLLRRALAGLLVPLSCSPSPSQEATGDAGARAPDAAGLDASVDAAGLDASVDASVDAPTDRADGSETAPPAALTCNPARVCALSWGALRAVVDAARGGRLIEMSLDGDNALVAESAVPSTFGSTFWTSPQAAWGWPPIMELDSGEYTTSIQPGRLILTSRPFMLQGRSLVVEKALSARPPNRSLRIEYTLENAGREAIDVAPWEVSRVPPEGLVFFPDPSAGALRYPNPSWTAMPVRTENGHTFFPYDVRDIPSDRKLFADGGEKGYLAFARGDLLLVKSWVDVPSTARAPGEGEIEIFANGGHTYVELEQQGRYTTLASGQRLTFTVDWSLVRLPLKVGSATSAVNDPSMRALLVRTAESSLPSR